METFDVLIVGAGISGIGAARQLQMRCPERSFCILEGRERLGGTWDLFRYPGIRSDSDMYTLGFRFKPWTAQKAIADGPSILRYLDETAEDGELQDHLRLGHQVVSARWDSSECLWTVEIEQGDGARTAMQAQFLFMCTGYYDYAEGYTPSFPGRERFGGQTIHPQHWPEDVDLEGKRVVVIGSGATAVTLVPQLADRAASVTMLQRTPTYVISVPAEDGFAEAAKRRLPPSVAYRLARWKNILYGLGVYGASRRAPRLIRKLLKAGIKREVGDAVDVERHFDPPYDPWDQRMCLVPDADLFIALREGKARIVTGAIRSWTEGGIELEGGEHLDADIIVTATGLKLQFLSGMRVEVDGERIEPTELWTYKGMMFSGVPNLAVWFGYTNASWTLKADLTSEYVCRLLNHMRKKGYRRFTPRADEAELSERPFLDLTSGYVKRAASTLPKQGERAPWRLRQNYIFDLVQLRFGKLEDDEMEFV